ncbi:MAG: WecB/TagA/CpsF family glycosyltransferase, partial [Muribaculaceae bacterium]|nr:WecB/TagA/CpsF family glycosyltransferase [Muribaculaceae bacterium]
DLYDKFDEIFVDGISMCWLIRLLWGVKITRLSFDMSGMAIDLFDRLNNNHSESIFFIGSKQESIEQAVTQFKSAYPKMNVIGFRNGYFKDGKERADSIRHIISADPTFVVVGMGSPLQERYAIDLKEAGYNGTVFTCGGFFHQSTNNINYYPEWINKYNLRAFYRLFREKGLWGRLYNVLVQFPILFSWDTIGTKLFN